MRYATPGQAKTVAQFREHLARIDPGLGVDDALLGRDGPLGAAFELGARRIGNRFCVQPMEGWDGTRAGGPSDLTLRRWRRFGASGAKLVWGGEAYAVAEDGRAHPHQLFFNDAGEPERGLAALLAELRAGHAETGERGDDLFVGLQLTHSGRFAHPGEGCAAPRIAFHHGVLDARFGIAADLAPLGDDELEAIGERFVRAARLAREVGFDFVDVKCCHGYLLHELLAARTREGRFGGSFENRTRLFRSIVAGIRCDAPGLEIGVRVSIADVFPHAQDPAIGMGAPLGWDQHLPYEQGFGVDALDPRRFDLSEPFRFLALLQSLGIRLVNVSLGSPYYSPHLQRPAAYPPSDGYGAPEDPLGSVATHLRLVRACKRSFPALAFVGSGYSYLQEWLPNVAQHEVGGGHVDFVGLGRMVLAYPDLPRDVLAGRPLDRRRICRTFSDCTTAPRKGMVSGCYPLDPLYKSRPEARRLIEVKRERRLEE